MKFKLFTSVDKISKEDGIPYSQLGFGIEQGNCYDFLKGIPRIEINKVEDIIALAGLVGNDVIFCKMDEEYHIEIYNGRRE